MPTQITAVMNQKGGSGKTTLSMNLAAGLVQRWRTALVDLDPQASSVQWSSQGVISFPVPVKTIRARWGSKELRQSFRAFEHLVLDCPPSLETHSTRQALEVCDVALIPILPSPIDLWASLRLFQEVAEVRLGRSELKVFLVLNQVEPQSAISAAMKEALWDCGLPVLTAVVRRRAVYKAAALDGVSVFQMGRRGEQAAAEINSVIQEVYAQ